MTTTTPHLEALIRDLPPTLRLEVADFVEFLLTKRTRSTSLALRQDWADHPSPQPITTTSVDLQHQALTWRGQ